MRDEKIREFLANAELSAATLDAYIESIREEYNQEFDRLLRTEEGRDDDVFNLVGVDPGVTISEYGDVSPEQRDLNWLIGVAAMLTAIRYQLTAKHIDKIIIGPAAAHDLLVASHDLTTEELIKASKDGIKGSSIKAISKPVLSPVSVPTSLRGPAREVMEQLIEMGAVHDVQKAVASELGTAQQLLQMPGASPQFEESVQAIVKRESGDRLTQTSRFGTQVYTTVDEMAKKSTQKLVWMCENDKSSCANCVANGGKTKTLAQWLRDGIPGAGTCKGADRCRCQLLTT